LLLAGNSRIADYLYFCIYFFLWLYMNICFLIRYLGIGGAEKQLIELAKGLRAKGHEITVLVYREGGQLEQCLSDTGISLVILEKRGKSLLRFLFALIREIRILSPDILHSYLHLSNCLAISAKPFINKKTKIVCGIRSAYIDIKQYGWQDRLIYTVASFLSRFADLVIYNSYAARTYASSRGFSDTKAIVIHNGFDTSLFYPDSVARDTIRKEWNVLPKECLIGLIGRFDYMKDHSTFLRAAALVQQVRAYVKFICIGHGNPDYLASLNRLIHSFGLNSQVLLIPPRNDMRAVYNGIDVLCSSSLGESLSNVIGEAMACGKLCVVTDVGDSAYLVGQTGVVVPPSDPDALANGLLEVMSKLDSHHSRQAMDRICSKFSLTKLIDMTEKKLYSLLEK